MLKIRRTQLMVLCTESICVFAEKPATTKRDAFTEASLTDAERENAVFVGWRNHGFKQNDFGCLSFLILLCIIYVLRKHTQVNTDTG